MPPRNSVRTEKIVAATALLFARQGYHGTSTREIARLAEVSENTLFRHFDHKEDIFWSALRSNAAALKPRRDLLEGIKAGDGPEVVLPKILELLSDTMKYKPEVLRLIAVALLELQGKGEALCRDLISPLFSEISRYLASSVEKGQVMDVDPAILASSLTAMVLIHPQILRLTDGDRSSLAERRDAVHVYSEFGLMCSAPGCQGSPIPRTADQTST